jgi:hypothetical protein
MRQDPTSMANNPKPCIDRRFKARARRWFACRRLKLMRPHTLNRKHKGEDVAFEVRNCPLLLGPQTCQEPNSRRPTAKPKSAAAESLLNRSQRSSQSQGTGETVGVPPDGVLCSLGCLMFTILGFRFAAAAILHEGWNRGRATFRRRSFEGHCGNAETSPLVLPGSRRALLVKAPAVAPGERAVPGRSAMVS